MAAEKDERVETPAPIAPTNAAKYVVQRMETVDIITKWSEPDRGVSPTPPLKPLEWTTADYWVDIATIPLPPKSQRKGAIKRGLAEAGIKPTADLDKIRVRVLDADSARVVEVPVVVAEPAFDI